MQVFLDIKVHSYIEKGSSYGRRSSYSTSPPDIHHSEAIANVVSEGTLSSIVKGEAASMKALAVDPSTLSKPVKIYFDPSCKYPRYKLKDNKDFKRVIKITNADVVIYESISGKIGYSSLQYNSRHFLVDGEIHSIQNRLLEKADYKTILKLDPKTKVVELTDSETRYVTKDIAQSLYNLCNVYTKIISDKQLDMMINSTLMNMTDDDYSSIKGMLKSKDDETFKLGLKMLIGYNTNSNAVRIGTLLREYCHDRAHMMTDVNTQQILKTLDIARGELSYRDTGKSYVKKLITKSTGEEDKAFARRFIIEHMYEALRESCNNWTAGFEELCINIELNIT